MTSTKYVSICQTPFHSSRLTFYQSDKCTASTIMVALVADFPTSLEHIIWLIHLPLVPHICVSESGEYWFTPIRRQAIILTNAGSLRNGPLTINCSEILIKTQFFHSWKCIWKISSAAIIVWRPFVQGRWVNIHMAIADVLMPSCHQCVSGAPEIFTKRCAFPHGK